MCVYSDFKKNTTVPNMAPHKLSLIELQKPHTISTYIKSWSMYKSERRNNITSKVEMSSKYSQSGFPLHHELGECFILYTALYTHAVYAQPFSKDQMYIVVSMANRSFHFSRKGTILSRLLRFNLRQQAMSWRTVGFAARLIWFTYGDLSVDYHLPTPCQRS